MEAYWGSGGIAPHIPDHGCKWMWVVNFTPRPLYPQGKSTRYPLDWKLSGPQSRSDVVLKHKDYFYVPRVLPRDTWWNFIWSWITLYAKVYVTVLELSLYAVICMCIAHLVALVIARLHCFAVLRRCICRRWCQKLKVWQKIFTTRIFTLFRNLLMRLSQRNSTFLLRVSIQEGTFANVV
jgi:hypothetical protein